MTEETPWALALRLRSEGASLETVVEQLQQRGLSREDVELLLKDAPQFAPQPRPRHALYLPPLVFAPARPKRPTDIGPGSKARWVGITFLTVGVEASGWFASTSAGSGLAAFAVTTAAVLVLLASEVRVGPRRTAQRLGFVLFFVCFFPGISGFVSGWNAFTIPSALAAVVSFPVLIWARRARERIKGIADFLPVPVVFENNGVQFIVGLMESRTYAPGDSVEIYAFVQNCVDARRDLRLTVAADPGVLSEGVSHTLPLDPGCVLLLTIPVRIGALAPAWSVFVLNVEGLGEGGRRLRIVKGQAWVPSSSLRPSDLWAAVSSAAVGLAGFRLGAHGTIRVKVDTSLPVCQETRFGTLRLIYQPTPEELQTAARS